jgi:hypothetical protein
MQNEQPETANSEVTAATALPYLVTSSDPQAGTKHEDAEEALEIPQRLNKSGKLRAIPFPLKLMRVLTNKQYEHTITWMPNGKSFAIVKPEAFVAEILPMHFKAAKYASFTRKLYRWGFTRVADEDEDSEEFYHKFFQKGRVDLSLKMTCHTAQFKARLVPLKTQEPAPLPTTRSPASSPTISPQQLWVQDHMPILPFSQSLVSSNNDMEAMELEAMRLTKSIQAASMSRRILAMIHQQRKNAFLPTLGDPRSCSSVMEYSAPVLPLYHLYRQQMGTDAWLQALRTSQPSVSQKAVDELSRIKNIQGAKTA